jgi:ABC-type Fe3+/spermidine/putrescine transport system ATPase subunit
VAVVERFADVTSFLRETREQKKKKNASATHLHDLLGINPDEFEEEKRASGGEQQNEAVSL